MPLSPDQSLTKTDVAAEPSLQRSEPVASGAAAGAKDASLESRFPAPLLQSLTTAQVSALVSLINASRTRHTIEYRVSLPTVFWGQFYFTIFAGPERRNAERLAAEGQTSLARQTVFVSIVLAIVISCALFGVFCLVYLLKSALGLDLFRGGSPFHPLYRLFMGR